MLNNNNERTRVRVRRRSRKTAATKRRNVLLLLVLGLTSVSVIGAMFGATPTGKYVAGLMKDSVSRIFTESTTEQSPGQQIESLRRKTGSANTDQMVLADRSRLNPIALPVIEDTYPEGDGRNWDVDALISRKTPPEDSSITDPMNPERYGLEDLEGGPLSGTSLWAAISYDGNTGNFFNASTASPGSRQFGAGSRQFGSFSGGGIIPSGNPGDALDLYDGSGNGDFENTVPDEADTGTQKGNRSPQLLPLFSMSTSIPKGKSPAQVGPDSEDQRQENEEPQQENRLPEPLPQFDVDEIAPNDEPLIPTLDEEKQQQTVNAGSNSNGSVEVSEPATIAIFGLAALYLFGLRRVLTKKTTSTVVTA